MVDRLIEACAAAKRHTNFLPFERTLVPVAQNWLDAPVKTVPKREGTPNKERNKKKTKKARAGSPPTGGHNRASPQIPVKASREDATVLPSKQWAGPGYVLSPKPEALPLPPASLLRKASA
ncbi:hypothetical protein COCOBI_06-3600 [Coccomyxa sp. Obi]|nr:hypothetical protein COCOBI_06-3600 [Coccomyxa sp. Obi]